MITSWPEAFDMTGVDAQLSSISAIAPAATNLIERLNRIAASCYLTGMVGVVFGVNSKS